MLGSLSPTPPSPPQGLEFDVEPSSYDESLVDVHSFPSPAGYVEQLAYEKAAEVRDIYCVSYIV